MNKPGRIKRKRGRPKKRLRGKRRSGIDMGFDTKYKELWARRLGFNRKGDYGDGNMIGSYYGYSGGLIMVCEGGYKKSTGNKSSH